MKFLVLLTVVLTWSVVLVRGSVGPVWPTRKIAFAFSNIIDFDFEERNIIKNVLRQIQESLSVNGDTCIEFHERTNQKDYILFVDKGDCSSGIGYAVGINNISLNKGCLKTGTIIHEILHRLGFDDQSSRANRGNKKIFVHLNNTISFDESGESGEQQVIDEGQDTATFDTPYDFHSMINHQKSNTNNNDNRASGEKMLTLLPEADEAYENREKLSPLDIFKVQRFYNCRTIDIPEIMRVGDSIEAEKIETISERFKLETGLKEIDASTAEHYLKKTHEMCGLSHYWPHNYPIVSSSHQLYKLMCVPKKTQKARCKFSIECEDEQAVCFRPFLWPTGYCAKSDNEKLNAMLTTLNDSMVKMGKKVKTTYHSVKKWISTATNKPSSQPSSK